MLKVTDMYTFGQEIGNGSTPGAVVVAAQNRKTKKKVAIKAIDKTKIKNKQRLAHEINIMKQLRGQPLICFLIVSFFCFFFCFFDSV